MKTYTAEILDAEDGSGDQILQFPPEFCIENGWLEDDTISFRVEGKNLILRNISKDEREGLSKQVSQSLD